MSSTPPVGTPGLLSVVNPLASIQKNIISGMTPAQGVLLQDTQLEFVEDIFEEQTPMNVLREGGVGTFGLGSGPGYFDLGYSLLKRRIIITVGVDGKGFVCCALGCAI
jgi:hypothetical protein